MKNNLDKHMREKLDGYEISPAPTVWNGIQGHLKGAAKRQYGWLAGLFFVLVLAGGISYYFLSNQTSDQEKSVVPQAQKTSSVDRETPKNTKQTFTESKNASDQLQNAGVNAIEKGVNSVSESSPKGGNLNQNKKTGDKKNQARSEDNATIAEQNRTANPISDFSSNDQTKQIAKQEISANDAEQFAQSTDAVSAESQSKGTAFIEKSWAANNLSVSELASNNNYTPVQTAAFLTLEEKQKRALSTFDVCDVLFPSLEDCPEFGDRRRRYQIDAYAQTGRLFSHLTNNQLQEEVNSYLNQRRSTENPTWHVGFGVRLSTQWTSGISLRGGLQIAQSRIRVDYVDESESQTTVNVSIDTITDTDGNTTVIWDTISIIETGVIERSHTNTFTQIDIPITVGYTFFGPRYDVEVNAGVMFNVLFQRSGRVFGPDDSFYELDRTGAAPGTQPYSSDLGLSLVTSVALNYRLSHQFSVFVFLVIQRFFTKK
ncbi:MAG: hypothetical protein GVX96_05800 [Bacteroidetes bacterium]|jgi:hypothetical protein|nr:hypothetical protein [Bacteroidota bacterium]